MSENLDIVRSVYAAWERGDYSSVAWAHPEIEYVILRHRDGFAPVSARGHTEMREAARNHIDAWTHLRIAAEEYRVLDSERVLVLDDLSGRGKRSGLEIGELGKGGAHLFHVRDGMVRRLVVYDDRNQAIADLGLEE